MERSEFEQWRSKEVARLLSLVETERRYYQEIVATLPVALAVLSGDRSIVSANRAFRQLFGLTVDEARAALDAAQEIETAAYDAARRTAHHARRGLKDVFSEGGLDVLLTYAAPGAAPAAARDPGGPQR